MWGKILNIDNLTTNKDRCKIESIVKTNPHYDYTNRYLPKFFNEDRFAAPQKNNYVKNVKNFWSIKILVVILRANTN